MADPETGKDFDAVTKARRMYGEQTQAMRANFEREVQEEAAGARAIRARADAVDALVTSLSALDTTFGTGVSLVAVGGYGRRELFPFSDVDLMFLLDAKVPERSVRDAIRKLNQQLWDCGLRVSPVTRTLAECERFDSENVEFTLALLDARHVAGDATLTAKLAEKSMPKLVAKEQKKIVSRLKDVTRNRHAKYGSTLFHLEPNLKECPGGLRDANVCTWLAQLKGTVAVVAPEFLEALEFLQATRVFLHLRHGRDDNVLDWQTQDEAAAAPLGVRGKGLDAAYWMRLYFRHARSINRRTVQALEEAQPAKAASRLAALTGRAGIPETSHTGFEVRQGRLFLLLMRVWATILRTIRAWRWRCLA